MRIWLATVGEPLPTDGHNLRLLRTAQFAQWLSTHGHEVTFWTGTMDHYGRRLRHDATHVEQVAPGYTIVQLAGRSYRKTISYARFMNHVDVAKEFSRRAPEFEPPNIIMSSFPIVELCEAIHEYAADRSVPHVIDVRDFWPDIFAEVLPKPVRWMAPIAFAAFEGRTRKVLREATGLSGMTQSALDWALRKADRKQSEFDFWHSFTYPAARGAVARLEDMPDPLEVDVSPDNVKFCFFGTHSHRVNLEMFVRSFLKLEQEGVPASLMLCGKGKITDELRALSKGSRAVRFPGWLNAEQIRLVMSKSDIGVLPYNAPDFHLSIPNKVAEYLSGGLPVLSCTEGEMRMLIEREGCGFWCQPDEGAIVTAVKAIVAERGKIAQAGVAAGDVFKRMFDAETVFGGVVEHFETIIARTKT